MTYVYSVLRFVPDPARAEFVNIGAVAGSDEIEDWDLRLVSNLSRAKAIDDRDALGTALAFLGQVEGRISALETLPGVGPDRMSRETVRRWAHEMQNVLQFTEPAPMVAESAEEALDLVFDELLLDPTTRRFRFQKKHRAISATLASYRLAEVSEQHISQKISVRAGTFQDAFDFAVHNGSVVQLVRCWSFQLPGQQELAEEVKAWGWLVEQLRLQGGRAILGGDEKAIGAANDTDLAVVYIPPAADQIAPAFDEARAVWDVLGITAVEPSRAEEVGAEAARRLRIHVF